MPYKLLHSFSLSNALLKNYIFNKKSHALVENREWQYCFVHVHILYITRIIIWVLLRL